MSFSKNLLALRKAQGLSQDELGSQLSVSRQTISKWELGETTPEMDKLILLSDYFNISLDRLIKEAEPPLIGLENEKIPQVRVSHPKENVHGIIKLGLKIIGSIVGAIILIDVIVMIIYFTTQGFPQS